MLKPLFTFIFCSMMMPAVMASGSESLNSEIIVASDDDDDDEDFDERDDDRDDDEQHIVGISRPEVVCRNVSKNSAELILKVRVRNKTNKNINGVVSIEIEDNEGKDVAKVNDKIQIPAGKAVLSKSVVTLRNPHLFNSNRSYRYKVEAEMLDNRGEEISKEKSSKFVIGNGMGTVRKNTHYKKIERKIPGKNLKKKNLKLHLDD